MSIAERIHRLKATLPDSVRLVAVSKFHGIPLLQEAYDAGQRLFGENQVQELLPKYEQLPKDIEWHFIGHLQSNKVKYIAPFIHTVHSADSEKLLEELDKQAAKFSRTIRVLLQVHIAQEEHKFGFSPDEMGDFLQSGVWKNWKHLQIAGLMGMATYTGDANQIRKEFASLAAFFRQVKAQYFAADNDFRELSIGMSDDYPLAIEAGSTLVRIGSRIFGERNYRLE